mgnify:CR=1 FL=1
MATRKTTHPPEPPAGPRPDWWPTLKAQSFAEGVQEADRYIANAEANARQAGVHPVDPDRFLDAKYSSTAAQQGYMAAMILVDGFVASCPLDAINFAPDPRTFQPSDRYPTLQEAEKARREAFLAHGLNGMHAYVNFLKLTFSEKLANLFRKICLQLHIASHYQQDEEVAGFKWGFQILKDYQAKFTAEARKQLEAAGAGA